MTHLGILLWMNDRKEFFLSEKSSWLEVIKFTRNTSFHSLVLRLNVKIDGNWKNAVLAYNPIVGCLISSRFLFKQDPRANCAKIWLTNRSVYSLVWKECFSYMLDHYDAEFNHFKCRGWFWQGWWKTTVWLTRWWSQCKPRLLLSSNQVSRQTFRKDDLTR